ncbi:hypothetical protein [Amycolatopsis minnesotensis]|uniref:ABC transporter permease n=1 Tax=Amycolatopsis minnesotensis TaxID=337894 RepID=A0ABN2QQZ3_9PSEU
MIERTPPATGPGLATVLWRVARAEWRKVVLQPKGTWFHVVFAALALAGAVLMGVIARQAVHYRGAGADQKFLDPHLPAIGMVLPGLLVAMVACGYRVISEYENGIAAETLRAVPHRPFAFVVKAALSSVSFALLAIVLMPVLFLVTESIATGDFAYPATILSHGGVRTMFTFPVMLGFLCLMSAAIAAALRNSALAVAALIAWYAVVEELLPTVPGVGTAIATVLPIANGWVFTGYTAGGSSISWPPAVSFLVLFAWVAVAVSGASALVVRRDVRRRS